MWRQADKRIGVQAVTRAVGYSFLLQGGGRRRNSVASRVLGDVNEREYICAGAVVAWLHDTTTSTTTENFSQTPGPSTFAPRDEITP